MFTSHSGFGWLLEKIQTTLANNTAGLGLGTGKSDGKRTNRPLFLSWPLQIALGDLTCVKIVLIGACGSTIR